MSSPASMITIGSYCADFTITEPVSATNYVYYRFTDTDNSKQYYIVRKSVVTGIVTDDTDVSIIESPYILPINSRLTTTDATQTNIFKEARFKPVWNSSLVSTVSGTGRIIPSNLRRFLMSKDTATDVYDSTKTRRFVNLSTDPTKVNLEFNLNDASSETVYSLPSGTTAPISGNYVATIESPIIQQSSSYLFYMVLKGDYDTLATTAVTSQKQLRYLVASKASPSSPITFELRDLYDPDITVSTIAKTAYRLSTQTIANLTSLTSDTVTKSAGKYGIDIFTHTTDIPLSSSVDPVGAVKTLNRDAFTTIGKANGFDLTDFFKNNGSSYTAAELSTAILGTFSDISGSYIRIPAGFVYTDYTSDPNGTTITTSGPVDFIMWQNIPDKVIEELFTNLDVTLLKLIKVKNDMNVPGTGLSAGGNPTSTEYYTGFEFSDRTNESTRSTLTSGNYGENLQLIARDYFKYKDPVRATQFKFYDLGKQTEYLWQIRTPDVQSARYVYPADNGSGNLIYTESVTTRDVRGWLLEYDNSLTPPGVRLQYSATQRYLKVDQNNGILNQNFNNTDDMKPFRFVTLTPNKEDAAIFNCIMCTEIDPGTGACKPITTNAYTGGIGAAARQGGPVMSPTFTNPIGGQLTSAPFKMLFGAGATGTGYVGFITTTSLVSPTPPKFVSPIPVGTQTGTYEDAFVLTNVGGRISGSVSKAFFLKSRTRNQYLRVAPGNTTVDFVSTNAPSEEDGYAWVLTGNAGNTNLRLYSVTPTSTVSNTRALQSTGISIGSATASPAIISIFNADTNAALNLGTTFLGTAPA